MPEKQYFTGIDIINAPRIESLTVTEDGTYTASSDVIGYNPVVVNTNQPWQPLEDGYSNFWFELTNDTLSPWLNFSAKNNDAVIDWGDGSGEVALDTLTPTHTYSKAGKYVVKVKGVTGLARQVNAEGHYNSRLKYIEFNDEIASVSSDAFAYCSGLEQISVGEVSYFSERSFQFATSLYEVNLNAETLSASCFYYCTSLAKATISNIIEDIGAAVFSYCRSLSEIHVQATTPPTLGENVFRSIKANFIIYVPVGTGETYKSASGWSVYADHILEEGQTPNRAMLSRLAKAADTDTDNEEMR